MCQTSGSRRKGFHQAHGIHRRLISNNAYLYVNIRRRSR